MKINKFDKNIMQSIKKPVTNSFFKNKSTMPILKKPFNMKMPKPNTSIMSTRPITPVQKINRKLMGDYDRDGVRNVIDCQPMNPYKQGPEQNMNNETIFFVSGTQWIENDMRRAINKSNAKILDVDRTGQDTYGQELSIFRVKGDFEKDGDIIDREMVGKKYEESYGGIYKDYLDEW